MVSIKDIARALSISPSSVSLVLSGKAREKRISSTLEAKIKATAIEMGYHPNRAAVSLRTGKSRTIGLIVENISNHFFSTLAKIIEDEVRKLRYNVVYCSTENDIAKGKEVIQMLYQQQVDGYLITPTEGMQADIARLIAHNKPVVLMDRSLEGIHVSSVLVDNYKDMKKGMEYLVKKGKRKIGFVTVDLTLFQMEERERAYREVHREHSITYSKSRMLKLSYRCSREEAVAQISAFIGKKEFDALVFATNYLGIYGLLSLKDLQRRISADFGILCFDDHDVFELHEPGITVIRQPIHHIAKAAVKMLVAALDSKEPLKKENILLSGKLIIRASV